MAGDQQAVTTHEQSIHGATSIQQQLVLLTAVIESLIHAIAGSLLSSTTATDAIYQPYNICHQGHLHTSVTVSPALSNPQLMLTDLLKMSVIFTLIVPELKTGMITCTWEMPITMLLAHQLRVKCAEQPIMWAVAKSSIRC